MEAIDQYLENYTKLLELVTEKYPKQVVLKKTVRKLAKGPTLYIRVTCRTEVRDAFRRDVLPLFPKATLSSASYGLNSCKFTLVTR